MQVSIEVSMYPLMENYLSPIQDFIHHLRSTDGISVETNVMSTQVIGEYDLVMNALQQAIAKTYNSGIKASFSVKVLPGNLKEEVNLDF